MPCQQAAEEFVFMAVAAAELYIAQAFLGEGMQGQMAFAQQPQAGITLWLKVVLSFV